MTERLSAIVGARITEFRKKMAEVKKIAKTVPNKIVVNVEARVNKFQQRMEKLANTIRTFSTIAQNALGGGLLMVSPATVPILVALVGALVALGPMIGTIAGSTFALGSAFGFAGTAAVAFGAVAIPTIAKLFDETTKLTSAQKKAKGEFTKFQTTWQGIVKDLENPVLEAFGKSMQFATRVITMARPLFDSAAKAVNNLLTSLNASLDTPPVKAFFDYMNKNAGPLLETLGNSFGNFTQGFMSMMVAFGPLAEQTAQGFLNMSKGFAEWSAGLSKSDKFQSFVTYINENMPKIRAIFRDALAGIVYFFSAFGPLSSDMMTSLQDMMARFKEWARTLGENQQFQQFIGYIRDNAPGVITLIGNLTNFLINLGIGLAPIGSAILGIVNNMLSWTNSMMQAHPVIGQIIAVLVVIAGAFIALTPAILAATTVFSGFGSMAAGVFGKVMTLFAPFKANLIIGLKLLGRSVINMAKTFVVNFLKIGARFAWLGVQALIHAGRIAASFFIAMGPIGWVIAAVIALVVLIIANWDKVKSATIRIFGAVWKWLKSTWKNIQTAFKVGSTFIYQVISNEFNEILSFVKGLGSSFYNAGKGLIDQIIKGIKSMIGKVTSTVSSVASKIRNFLPFSPAKVGPLSDLNKLDFGGPVQDSLNRAKSAVRRSMTDLLSMDTPMLAFDTSLNKSDFGRIRQDIGAEVSSYEKQEPIINVYNEWDGEKVVSYVEQGSARRSRITDGFGGK